MKAGKLQNGSFELRKLDFSAIHIQKIYLALFQAPCRADAEVGQSAASVRDYCSGFYTPSFSAGYRVLREQLISEGKLVVDGEDCYRFATDVAFSSPSAAAAIVAGRSASGPTSWYLPETGKTYKESKLQGSQE